MGVSKQQVQKGFLIGVTIGLTAANAAFSLVGMCLLARNSPLPTSTHIPLASISAICAGSIEWEVYWQNIKNVYVHGSLKHSIIEDHLIKRLNETKNIDNLFLQRFREHYLALQARLEQHDKDAKTFNEILDLQNKLNYLYESAWKHIKFETNTELEKIFTEQDIKQLNQKYFQKSNLRAAAQAIVLMSMVGSYFTTISVAHIMMVTFGLCISSTPAGAIVIASIAAIGFGLMMLKTFQQLIYNDLLQNYWEKLKASFHNSSALKKLSICLSLTLFTGLFIILSLGTVGTLWKTGVNGQMLLFKFSNLVINSILTVFIGAYIFSNCVFNLKNIAETIDRLSKTSKQAFIDGCKESANEIFISPYKDILKNRGALEIAIRLPIYALISLTNVVFFLWNKLVFAGHCISEGVTIDNAFLIGKHPTAAASTLMEGATDWHYTSTPHEHKHAHDHHHHEGKHDHTHHKPQIKKTQIEDHHHSNLAKKFLCVVASPILAINTLLYFAASGKGIRDAYNKCVTTHWEDEHHEHAHAIPEVPKDERFKQEVNLFYEKKQRQNQESKSSRWRCCLPTFA